MKTSKCGKSSVIEVHSLIIKGSMFQEDITILNIFVPNNTAQRTVELSHMELKRKNKIFLLYMKTSISLTPLINSSTRQKTKKGVSDLHHTINHFSLTDIIEYSIQ